ncbi:MAG: CRISPR-associated endonuclease Cas1 [Acidobacteriota bacterium]
MATLFITEQGATLRKEANRLVVERDDIRLLEIHDFKCERVVVFGNVQLTTQAMSFLVERGIDTTFLSLHGKLKARLAPLESKNSLLRVRQYERTLDPAFALSIAKAIVTAKINNCADLLKRHQRNHDGSDFRLELSQLAFLAEEAGHRRTVDSLRGIEGQAAAVYFPGFGKALRRQLQFTKRTRRPPKDPVNALLSFGYTLLYGEAIAALACVGFDSYLGFLHSFHYGRCSLALDLMEEFRPLIVDRLVLKIINLEVVKPDDFETVPNTGVNLNTGARKRFFREYETVMSDQFKNAVEGEQTSLRRALHQQALALQRAVIEGGAYTPFRRRGGETLCADSPLEMIRGSRAL